MNNSNVLCLYLRLCRLALSELKEKNLSDEFYNIITNLRGALACCICGRLVVEPHGNSEEFCAHYVCLQCKSSGAKPIIACEYCDKYIDYVPCEQTRLVVNAFKKICEYIKVTDWYGRLQVHLDEFSCTRVAEIIDEVTGSAFITAERTETPLLPVKSEENSCAPSDVLDGGVSSPPASEIPVNSDKFGRNFNGSDSIPSIAGYTPFSSVQCSVDSTVSCNTSQRPPVVFNDHSVFSISSPVVSNLDFNQVSAAFGVNAREVLSPPAPLSSLNRGEPRVDAKKKASSGAKSSSGCRCGNATSRPGQLTCCGQRCPCYVESRACVSCPCRGCRNPHRPGGRKVLPYIPSRRGVTIHTVDSAPGSSYSEGGAAQSPRGFALNASLSPRPLVQHMVSYLGVSATPSPPSALHSTASPVIQLVGAANAAEASQNVFVSAASVFLQNSVAGQHMVT